MKNVENAVVKFSFGILRQMGLYISSTVMFEARELSSTVMLAARDFTFKFGCNVEARDLHTSFTVIVEA